jgi:hypothetical protein
LQARGAVRTDERKSRSGKPRRRPPGTLGQDEHHQGRTDRPRSLAGTRRLPPRFPGVGRRTRVHLRPVVAADQQGPRADGICATRRGAGSPESPRASVLVLLRLQRLQRQARRRLGDDPTRFRRGHARAGTTAAARARRLQPARGRRERALGRREARDSGRHTPRRLPGARLARELLHLGATPRPERRPGRRLRRHRRSLEAAAPAGGADPDEEVGIPPRLPVARLRRPLGRGAPGLLQRADRTPGEAPVEAPDHLGGHRVARQQLRDPCRGVGRHDCDRIFLCRRGGRIRPPHLARSQPVPVLHRALGPARTDSLAHVADTLAAVGAASSRAPPSLGRSRQRNAPDVSPSTCASFSESDCCSSRWAW